MPFLSCFRYATEKRHESTPRDLFHSQVSSQNIPSLTLTYDGNNDINKLCRWFLDKTLRAAVRMCGCVILCESIYDLMCAFVCVSVIFLHVCACVAQVSIFFFLFLLLKTYELLYWMERFFYTLFYLFFKFLFQWMHTCVFLLKASKAALLIDKLTHSTSMLHVCQILK